ncbi:hypothetical protein DB41_KP00010 [Neochlamydia sp. TUME1]|uniref:leucine-rich repeat domain-containing protein n=1 Tax=Neochlamydia sp. TUME1 TaxID=1478174 RepID=UPI000582EBCF|nr:leucine-rich repeat domain-containing protein [Neochlamydia sp. TUME1]KIC72269.1 hypothetical protein DB41_KP00010 [Neochlamydia sp. TUME1]
MIPSSMNLELLPDEIQVHILKDCASPSLFGVCTRWQHLLANEVIPSLYKQIGKMRFPQRKATEQTNLLDKLYKLPAGLSTLAKVKEIFRQTYALAKSLAPSEFRGQIEEKKYFTLDNYTSLLLSINRLLIESRLPGYKKYLDRPDIKSLPLEKKEKLFAGWIKRYGKNIKKFELTGSELTALPPEIGGLSQLHELKLNDNHLFTLTAKIGKLFNLKELCLNGNHLTSLPAKIGQLSQLQELFLGSNKLTTLPAAIGQLSKLRGLYLNDNQLTILPAEIGNLSHLQELFLGGNKLATLPSTIGQLSKLQALYLNDNQLTMLPEEIGQLSQLQELFLGGNKLATLPSGIGLLSQLRLLYLSNNQLTVLPASLKQLPAGIDLNLDGNLLESISP